MIRQSGSMLVRSTIANWVEVVTNSSRLDLPTRGIGANGKSLSLLLSLLTKEQRETLFRKRFIMVKTRRAKYRINYGNVLNIIEYGRYGKTPKRRFCITTSGVPTYDVMAAQLLYIETNENGFRDNANSFDVSPLQKRMYTLR